jgi:AraC family transcriptional activator FtrA
MPTVAMMVYDDVNPFQLGIATEIFGVARPELEVPWYRFLVCAGEARPIQTSSGLLLIPPYTLEQVSEADTVILPSSRPYVTQVSDRLRDTLHAAYQRGARLISFCTGAFLLAAVGLLDGRRTATHWAWSAHLAERYPRVRVDPRALYIDDGQILTAAGTAAAIDLSLYVVRQDYGAAVAAAVARRLVAPLQRGGHQDQYLETPLLVSAEDDLFNSTLAWMATHLDKQLTIEQMAARAIMSPRSFARRFHETLGTTPHRWLLQQRLALTQRLLETTNDPIELIASQSGFQSAATLRFHFQRLLHITPLAYRQMFRRAHPGASSPVQLLGEPQTRKRQA